MCPVVEPGSTARWVVCRGRGGAPCSGGLGARLAALARLWSSRGGAPSGRVRARAPGPARQAAGAMRDRPLMTLSMASPCVGSVRLASIFSTNFMRVRWRRPYLVAYFMNSGWPMTFTK